MPILRLAGKAPRRRRPVNFALDGMLSHAVLAFLALPGVVAYAIPTAWLLSTSHVYPVHPVGWIFLVAGTVGLLWCVRDFYVQGMGTLAPWAPPKSLVVVGLYRFTRNPMYVCVLVVLVGWAVSFASAPLGVYSGLVAVAFHLRVVLAEEPFLRQAHGQAWCAYANRVPRWFGPRNAV